MPTYSIKLKRTHTASGRETVIAEERVEASEPAAALSKASIDDAPPAPTATHTFAIELTDVAELELAEDHARRLKADPDAFPFLEDRQRGRA